MEGKNNMAWRYTVQFEDEINGETVKTFESDTFADYAAARAAADELLADIQAASSAGVVQDVLSEVTDVDEAPASGSRVFEVVDATINLVGGKRANFKLPSPVGALFSGNALDKTATAWTDLMANFTGTATTWQLSDGDAYDSTVTGKRAFVRSGKTNLPV